MSDQLYELNKRQFLFTAALFAALHTILYAPVYVRLVKAWGSMPQCSHGYFILPIALWLSVRKFKGKDLKFCAIKPSYAGCLTTCLGLCLYVAALVYESNTFAYLSYMISLAGLTVSLGGFQLLKVFLFPFFFLFFMFPIPDSVYLSMTASLKLMASYLSAQIIAAFGIPVLREGNIIQLPNLQLNVVEACSGMQSLVSYIMLGSLLAYFMSGSLWKRAALMAVTIPVALVNNIMRITGTGILAELFGHEAITGTLHDAFGLLTFALGFIVLISTYKLLVRISVNSCLSP